ncbi:hypothetical protein EYF80_004063 [Liparis tanakae]|uniref:Uncharacterized protein n=1 Tax=Liparis tanakae TaxID=230148 RepID=A0A4Z2J6L1_9TELE|nr:hypothetical protein EYF80_004063 [Liparis tanakae]
MAYATSVSNFTALAVFKLAECFCGSRAMSQSCDSQASQNTSRFSFAILLDGFESPERQLLPVHFEQVGGPNDCHLMELEEESDILLQDKKRGQSNGGWSNHRKKERRAGDMNEGGI